MKSFLVLAAVAVVTLGNAVAAMPSAVSTDHQSSALPAQPLLTIADQELPFDRYWSKN
ncbi:hypothetical protein [Bradyrhizobium jicamae]|uniref:hypothetical protein n=1 Tax=Bradyrhizobium jicamae TaxID=280332 RepID=UPI001BACECB3|nr:hypothetical protein [Bradyrhizobium jicamae]MBR0932288.1 hypothetical protein [Bradyrhizobium jicamae]